MVDVRGDVLRPPHGTTPAAVQSNKNQKWVFVFYYLGVLGPLSSKSKNEIEPNIQFDADETNAWSTRNKMGIHYKKSTCMTVGTKQKLSHTEKLNIKIENNEIEPVSSLKLLWITYRRKLKLDDAYRLSVCYYFL